MEEYVTIDGKSYRLGYTTGTCAAAAAKAAAIMLRNQKIVQEVSIVTPKGITVALPIHHPAFDGEMASCSVQKDGGDDIDATHGIDIYAKVIYHEKETIEITGGEGVGIVTKRGLDLPVGSYAINKVPRQMIKKAVEEINLSCGVLVTIFVPKGKEIAKKTFNERLGIEGGISIIGTTGIVQPMSMDAWKKSLALDLKVKREQEGLDKVILVPGNYGEDFVTYQLKKDARYIVRMSNFIGYLLTEAKQLSYQKLLLVGHLGKFIKLAGGIFNTHSKIADARMEILIAHLALMGAPLFLLKQVESCITTEEAMEKIQDYKYEAVYNNIAAACQKQVKRYLKEEEIEIGVIIFSMQKKILGKTTNASSLLEEFE